MHHITRYSSLQQIRPENVAEHSWTVAYYSLLISLDLRDRFTDLDLGEVLAKAVMHDVSETISGDIIRSYKYSTPEMKAATEAADDTNMRILVRDLPVGESLYEFWSEAKDDRLPGRIVAFADLISVVTYVAEEHAMGNRMLDHIMKAVYEDLLRPMRGHFIFGYYVKALFPTDKHTDPYRTLEEAQ